MKRKARLNINKAKWVLIILLFIVSLVKSCSSKGPVLFYACNTNIISGSCVGPVSRSVIKENLEEISLDIIKTMNL